MQIVLLILALLAIPCTEESWAESPAPSVHWGAISYPDQGRLLETGLTLNRFTELNASRQQFNAVRETSGFNFATISWTEHYEHWKDWSTNVTVGAGPTRDQPTNALQNQGVHRWLGFHPVPVHATREANDFMIDGTVTRWTALLGDRRTGFAGSGFSVGSLYQEVYARIGIRRFPIADLFGLSENSRGLGSQIARSVRFSTMGRYSRIWSGAAYHEVKPMSYLAQVSMSIGDYMPDPFHPLWELEFAFTLDSGLFVSTSGNSIEERFGSASLRIAFITFQAWNDSLNGHDNGPTYGGRFMVDLFQLYAR